MSTTPRRLRLLSVLIASAASVMTLVAVGALVVADVTVAGVQQRTVPSIFGMQRVHAWLADADRSAANAYLAGGSEVTLPELQYQADIAAASRELQGADERNAAGTEASARLRAIITLVDQYVELVQTASVDDRLGVTAGTVYLQAGTSLMHRPGGILAQVDSLRGFYAAALDGANRTLAVTASMAGVYVVVAALVLVLLVGTQRFLRARFRRRQNPWLAAATLLVLLLSVAGAAGVLRAGQAIRTADGQTYSRLVRLWEARALLYDANGNESLSLIANQGPDPSPAFDQAFQAETGQLVDRPLTDDLVARAGQGQVVFSGLLADELRASDTPQQRQAAMDLLRSYQTFMNADATMRATASRGAPADAVNLALGTDRGQLTFTFGDVDWYFGVAIQGLQDQFDATIGSAEQVLAVTAALELLTLAIVALTIRGVQPRIDEYR